MPLPHLHQSSARSGAKSPSYYAGSLQDSSPVVCAAMSWPVTVAKGGNFTPLAPFLKRACQGSQLLTWEFIMQEVDHAEARTRVRKQHSTAADAGSKPAEEQCHRELFAGPARQLGARQPQQPQGAHV